MTRERHRSLLRKIISKLLAKHERHQLVYATSCGNSAAVVCRSDLYGKVGPPTLCPHSAHLQQRYISTSATTLLQDGLSLWELITSGAIWDLLPFPKAMRIFQSFTPATQKALKVGRHGRGLAARLAGRHCCCLFNLPRGTRCCCEQLSALPLLHAGTWQLSRALPTLTLILLPHHIMHACAPPADAQHCPAFYHLPASPPPLTLTPTSPHPVGGPGGPLPQGGVCGHCAGESAPGPGRGAAGRHQQR